MLHHPRRSGDSRSQNRVFGLGAKSGPCCRSPMGRFPSTRKRIRCWKASMNALKVQRLPLPPSPLLPWKRIWKSWKRELYMRMTLIEHSCKDKKDTCRVPWFPLETESITWQTIWSSRQPLSQETSWSKINVWMQCARELHLWRMAFATSLRTSGKVKRLWRQTPRRSIHPWATPQVAETPGRTGRTGRTTRRTGRTTRCTGRMGRRHMRRRQPGAQGRAGLGDTEPGRSRLDMETTGDPGDPDVMWRCNCAWYAWCMKR